MNDLADILASFKKQAATTGVFSDLDGTLSRIALSPTDAKIDDDIKQLLECLRAVYKLVGIVTGRDSIDAANMVGLANLVYVGNHGLEIYDGRSCRIAPEASKYPEIAQRATKELCASRALNEIDGLLVEGKHFGVAIHYRLATDKEKTRARIESIIKPLAFRYGFRIAYGRNVVELKPPIRRNKGVAVRELSEKHHLKNVLYFGDDTTDIDAFVELRRMRESGGVKTLSVAVSSGEVDQRVIEEADYSITGIEEMPRVLGYLL
jgi:trehalose 6-phosphate phosphatase